MDPTALAREYYRAVDEGAYESLADLLAAEFVHDRPDRTLEGRERFVGFMRDDRPATDTTHDIEGVFVRETSPGERNRGNDVNDVAVRGRLLRADGSEWFRFVDVFDVENDRLAHLTTYTH
jgi:ketosteroid isomerase-like protein